MMQNGIYYQPYLICATCNYHYCDDIVDGKRKTIRGDKPFIEIYYDASTKFSSKYIPPDSYACPKCGTVRVSPNILK